MQLMSKAKILVAVATVVGVMLLTAGLLASSLAAAPIDPPSPVLGGASLKLLMLDSATDVTAKPDMTSMHPLVSRRQAIATAVDYLGASGGPVQVLQGMAPRIAAESARSVWIIVFKANRPRVAGPVGDEVSIPVSVAGILIDDQTGEVLRGFTY